MMLITLRSVDENDIVLNPERVEAIINEPAAQSKGPQVVIIMTSGFRVVVPGHSVANLKNEIQYAMMRELGGKWPQP